MYCADSEERAYALFKEKIKLVCKYNWCFMEMEDRISEASLAFFIALRTFSTRDGCFWPNYLKLLALHMQNLRPHYRDSGCRLSLNQLVPDGNNAAYPYSFLDLLPARDPDWTAGHVQRFLNTLSSQQQRVVDPLLEGRTRRHVCREEGLSSSELQQQLQTIIEDYRDYSISAEYREF